jgi:hypothetical protein
MGAPRMPLPDPLPSHACPHVAKDDPRCQERFRMAEIDAMYRYCLGGWYGCKLFHRINREQSHPQRAAPAPPQQVTVHGRARESDAA